MTFIPYPNDDIQNFLETYNFMYDENNFYEWWGLGELESHYRFANIPLNMNILVKFDNS